MIIISETTGHIFSGAIFGRNGNMVSANEENVLKTLIFDDVNKYCCDDGVFIIVFSVPIIRLIIYSFHNFGSTQCV